MSNDNHDAINEAQNRHHFEEREAYGKVDDDTVYLVATLNKHGKPKLSVMVGGEWYHYEDDDMRDEFVRSTKIDRRFKRVDMLDTAFSALVEKYGLQTELPEDWKTEHKE